MGSDGQQGMPWAPVLSRWWSLPTVEHAGFAGGLVALTLLLLRQEHGHEVIPLEHAAPLALARRMMATEALGRDAAVALIEGGIKDALAAGLLLQVEGGYQVSPDVLVVPKGAREREYERERKRRYRARHRDSNGTGDGHDRDCPGTSTGQDGDASDVSQGQHGTEPDKAGTSRVSRPVPAQEREEEEEQDPDPLAGIGDDPPSGKALAKGKAAELRNLAQREHFADAVRFVRWYGEERCRITGSLAKAPHLRIKSNRGVERVRAVLELFRASDVSWADFRRMLHDGAQGLLNDPRAQQGGWLEIDKHLVRDEGQLERCAAHGRAFKATGRHPNDNAAAAPAQQRAHSASGVGAEQRAQTKVPVGGTGYD